MKKLLLGLVVAVSMILPSPAYGDNEPCNEEGACQNRSGDCREVDEGGYCEDNDFSPTFDKSPVQDSFNFSPVICLPGSTCNVEEKPQKQTAAPELPNPACIPAPFHCDPPPDEL